MEIDPDRLRVIADVVNDASGLLSREYAIRSPGLAPRDGAESSTSAALRSASAVWDGLFRRVGGAVDVFGGGLLAAADAQVAADRRAAARMGSVSRLVGP